MLSATYTDQYTLTMAQSFYRHNHNGKAIFELFVRRLPQNRAYLVTAGLADALEFLKHVKFTEDDISYLTDLAIFDDDFLEYLSNWSFQGDVYAIPEGTIIPAGTPMLRVEADRISATIVESALLTIINHQTMIASKAARITLASENLPCSDFSLRRLHGPQATIATARAAFIGGFKSTSSVIAAQKLNIPVTGTMAHHFVMSYGPKRELEAFEIFLKDYPKNNTLLVDTYNTLEGIKKAVQASRNTGVVLNAVRLDSGNLEELSKAGREYLDSVGFNHTKITATNDLDEYKIKELLQANAPIDGFGVGTMLGVSADAPSLGGVYKLVAHMDDNGVRTPVMKLAKDKQTDPEAHLVFQDEAKTTLTLVDETAPGKNLTKLVMQGGVIWHEEELEKIQQRVQDNLAVLPDEVKKLTEFTEIKLERSPGVINLRRNLGDDQI